MNRLVTLSIHSARLALLAALVAVAHPMLADTVYTYTGNDFTTLVVPGPYTTSDSITGSFTVASPLADNLTLQSVSFLSYSFTDGVQTFTDHNSFFLPLAPYLYAATDASGNITEWYIALGADTPIHRPTDYSVLNSISDPSIDDYTDSGEIAPLHTIDGEAYNHDPGTWTSATVTSAPPSATPEPSSLILLGTGLLGAIGPPAARRRVRA